MAENPHIPKFIKDAPWYAGVDEEKKAGDYLAHHRSGNALKDNSEPQMGRGFHDDFTKEEEELPKASRTNRRLRKAKCTNCGSMDHDKRECLEKPTRKRQVSGDLGADTGQGKRMDELDYASKRDRWYGYDTEEYDDYVKKFEGRPLQEIEHREFDTDEEIELKELGLWEEGLQKDLSKATGEKIVRLREDKAVYLTDVRNESINYDPKTRMMVGDSHDGTESSFVKHLSGDAREFEEAKKFAWDGTKRGLEADNFASNPTAAALKRKEQTQAHTARSEALKQQLAGAYGSLDSASDGTVNGKSDEDVVLSVYPEDVYEHNHTSVWGSYYDAGRWGYRCCKSTDRNDLCS